MRPRAPRIGRHSGQSVATADYVVRRVPQRASSVFVAGPDLQVNLLSPSQAVSGINVDPVAVTNIAMTACSYARSIVDYSLWWPKTRASLCGGEPQLQIRHRKRQWGTLHIGASFIGSRNAKGIDSLRASG